MEIVRAERIAAGGDAIARQADGRIAFVTGAIPGELVEVEFTSRKKDFAKARVVSVVEPSPERVTPPCAARHAGCGGCGWQHIAVSAQLQLKREIVLDAMRRTGRLPDADIRLGPPMPSERSRTTVRVAVDAHGRAGFRAERSHAIVVPDACLIAHPLLDEMIALGRFRATSEVLLRVGARTGDRLAWAIADGGQVIGLSGGVSIGPDSFVTESVHGYELRASASSFFQSSPEAAEAIASAVVEAGGSALRAAGIVVDAYGGVGLLSVTAAPSQATIHLVERSASSVRDARVNLAKVDARFHQASVEQWKSQPAEVVLADPARSGLGPDAVAVLAKTGCSRLVLVSCDPVAAARDARLLSDAGFEFQFGIVLDPFPHTPHLELVSRFDRKESSSNE